MQDTFLWQVRGQSAVQEHDGAAVELNQGDIHLVMSGEEVSVNQSGGDSCVIAVTNNAFE